MKVSRGTTLRKFVNKETAVLLTLFFSIVGCGIHKPRYTIDDYVLVPNAKEIIGNKGLTAFVFENNKSILPFQQFLVQKFQLQTLNQREIPISINKDKFVLHVYDRDEITKYINTFDFIVKEQIPDASKIGDQNDFIVLSVVNERNEDCLNEASLYQNIVTTYLKNLKQEYLSNDR